MLGVARSPRLPWVVPVPASGGRAVTGSQVGGRHRGRAGHGLLKGRLSTSWLGSARLGGGGGREVSGGAGKCTAVRACPGGAAGWRIRSVAASLPRSALCGAGLGAGGGLRGTGRDGPGRAGPAGAALSRLPGP